MNEKIVHVCLWSNYVHVCRVIRRTLIRLRSYSSNLPTQIVAKDASTHHHPLIVSAVLNKGFGQDFVVGRCLSRSFGCINRGRKANLSSDNGTYLASRHVTYLLTRLDFWCGFMQPYQNALSNRRQRLSFIRTCTWDF